MPNLKQIQGLAFDGLQAGHSVKRGAADVAGGGEERRLSLLSWRHLPVSVGSGGPAICPGRAPGFWPTNCINCPKFRVSNRNVLVRFQRWWLVRRSNPNENWRIGMKTQGRALARLAVMIGTCGGAGCGRNQERACGGLGTIRDVSRLHSQRHQDGWSEISLRTYS